MEIREANFLNVFFIKSTIPPYLDHYNKLLLYGKPIESHGSFIFLLEIVQINVQNIYLDI